MTRDSGTRTGKKSKKRSPSSIPVEQVSPAVLSASRDVAFTLQQLSLELDGEEVLKAVLDRAAHLEEQASGITLIEDSSMTLGRFLVLFVVGLVIAWAVPQLTWMYWILAIAAVWVVVRLLRR